MEHKIKLYRVLMTLMLFLYCKIPMAEILTPQQIAEKAKAATVRVDVFDANNRKLGTGSGFFVRPNHIATNFHVIEGATAATLRAKLANQKKVYPIKRIRAVDKKHDLAILQVAAPGVQPLPLGDSNVVEMGDAVFVMGNPVGLEGTFSMGNVSQIRVLGNVKRLQFNAPIARGNSGGPVLNKDGNVIGVVSFKWGDIEILDFSANLNFAIPSNYLKALLNRHLGPAKPGKPNVTPKRPKPPKPVQPKPTTPKTYSSRDCQKSVSRYRAHRHSRCKRSRFNWKRIFCLDRTISRPIST